MVLINPLTSLGGTTWKKKKHGFWVNNKVVWKQQTLGSNRQRSGFHRFNTPKLEKSWKNHGKFMEKSGFGSQKTWPTAEATDPLGVSPLPRLTSRRVRASPPREERSTWRRLCPRFGGMALFGSCGTDIFEKIRPDIFDVDLFWGNSPRGHWGDYSAEKSVSHSKPSLEFNHLSCRSIFAGAKCSAP